MTNADLSENLSVAKETIRNDLILLEAEGILQRSHGRSEILQSDAAFEKLRSSGVLSKEERREEILKIIEAKEEARVGALANSFSVSGILDRGPILTILPTMGLKSQSSGQKADFIPIPCTGDAMEQATFILSI